MCHPELVSGAINDIKKEMLKQVQHDKKLKNNIYFLLPTDKSVGY